MSEKITSFAHCGKYPPDPRCIARQLGQTAIQVATHFVKTGKIIGNEAERVRRYEICKQCENYDSLKDRCKKCGCYMQIKTRLSAGKLCPLKKW
jgi:hypothetical protein